MKTSAEEFLKLAEEDFAASMFLKNAEKNLDRMAAYHLQQAIEKLLKAAILAHGYSPVFSHDINDLVAACDRVGAQYPPKIADLAFETSYWESKARYSIDFIPRDKTFQEVAALYTELHASVQDQINEYIYAHEPGEEQEDGADNSNYDMPADEDECL